MKILRCATRWWWAGASVVAIVSGCAGSSTLMRTTPEGRPVSGLQNSERDVAAFVRRAVDPREFAVSVTLDRENAPRFINAHRTRPGSEAVGVFISPEYSLLPMFEGTLDGRPVRLLVDPTSPANWTSLDRARQFGLTPLGPPLVYGLPEHVPDASRGALCAAQTLQIELLPVEAVLFYARPVRGPLWPLCRSADAREVDAVLGWSFLRAFETVRWELPARRIVFSSRRDLEVDSSPHVLARLPLEPNYGLMVVKGTIEGQTRPLLLDLAGEFELAMASPPPAPVRQVTMGDVVLRELRANGLEELGLGFPDLARVGLKALGRYVVVLDNHRNEVRIERPTTAERVMP